MSGKYLRTKKIVIPTLTLLILTSQLFGCSSATKDEALNFVQNSEVIEMEVSEVPEDTTQVNDQTQETIAWTPLSQLTTYPELRDKLNSLGIDISTNPTMQELMSNSEFIDAYFTNEDLQSQLNTIVAETYADLEPDDTTLQSIALNMYFDLLPDDTEGYFNGDSTLTRAQAMTILTRATQTAPDNGVVSQPTDNFVQAVGNNKYTPYAEYTDAYAFTSVANKTLDSTNFNTGITKAEYIYLVLNATGKLADTSELNLELSSVQKGSATTIAEALVTPENGVPAPIYDALALAVNYGLEVDNEDIGWDEVITKSEALQLLTQALYNTSPAGQTVDYESEELTPEQAEAAKGESDTESSTDNNSDTETKDSSSDNKQDSSSSSDKKSSSSSDKKKSSSSSDKKSSSSDKKKSSSSDKKSSSSDKKKSSSSSDSKKKDSSSSDKKSSSSDKKNDSSNKKKSDSDKSWEDPDAFWDEIEDEVEDVDIIVN